MIISRDKAIMMFKKMEKLKSISKFGIEQPEWLNWCHTINTINALETDDCIIGKSILDKFEIDKNLEHLILPYEVTYDGSDRYSNLLSGDYVQYDPTAYGYNKTAKETVAVMKPADFNEVSDVILSAFRKSSTPSNVETLKARAAITEYIDRMEYDGRVTDAVTRFVPVAFDVELRKAKFMNESSDDMFELWWVDTLRKLKGGKE